MKIWNNMKEYNILHIALLCTMLHNLHVTHAAEESKDNHDIIDISNIATQYPILEEGFRILHSLDSTTPKLHDYVQNHLIQDDETNFGEVIQLSQDYIADSMQEIFLYALENEIAQAKDAYIKFDRNQLCFPCNGKMFKDSDVGFFRSYQAIGTGQNKDYDMTCQYEKEYNQIYNIPTIQQALITSFYQIDNPVCTYLLKYQHIFLPSIFNKLRQNNSAQLFSLVNGAIRFNHVPLATLLFNSHAIDMHHEKYNIRKYLQNAVENYSLPVTKLVLDKTPLYLYQQFSFLIERAVLNDDMEMLQLLLSHGVFPSNTILDMAIDKNNTAAVIQLLTSPVDIEEKNDKGLTPLVHAVQKKNIEIVQALLQAGADANNPTSFQEEHPMTFDGQIAHQIDSSGRRVDIKTKELTDSLPNFNENSDESNQKRDLYGYTPLQEAVYANSLEIAKLLINHDAKVNISNIFDGTALQIAQRYNLDEIAQLLQDHHAISFTPHQRNLNISLRQGPIKQGPSLFDLWLNDSFPSLPDTNQEQTPETFTHRNKTAMTTLLDIIKESKIKNKRPIQTLQEIIIIDEHETLEQPISSSSDNNKRTRENDSLEKDSNIMTAMPNVRRKYN
ncbi:ankyrin repeat domain-containing protein [Candidatus Chromulinivorax destructor]|uniref:Uncharacterized protein n=1 Tax=Candidatus Chromulinivorax destructor TaxID=2066483 RepID=A0A345ZCJ9_9BACT|nr:ankyrin repeat domain-containing protein [Candidatus Chromulinivorax destructor]AXK61016.1 hypothetical protein C0J27_04765 [Candidatus Chromulinivorax destructor]